MKFVLLFLLLPLTLLGQNWTEPVNISTMNGVNQNPDLFIDHNEFLHCVWSHLVDDNYSHIYYSKSIDQGQTWSNPINISQNTEKWLLSPKIVVDSEDNIYVTYDYGAENPIHCKILMKKFDSNSWSQADTISGTMLNCRQNKLVIDHNNRIYCFWNHALEGGDYYYRYFENGIWSDYFHPFGDNFSFEKIVVDSENYLHVLAGHFDYAWYFNYVVYNPGENTWSDITLISELTNANGQDIDLDNNNHPHFAWRHKTPGTPNPFEEDSTLYRFFNGNEWSEPELITEDPFSQKIQLINSKVYIIDWEKTSEEGGNIVMYEKNDEGNWIGEFVLNLIGSQQKFLKSDNILHLLYLAKPNDENFNLYYINKIVDSTTSIEENKFTLNSLKIYPNPFSEIANIEFNILKESHVILRIHTYDGKLIKPIYNGNLPEGDYTKFWDGTNDSGEKVNKGAYLIRLIADKNIISRSVIFLK